MYIIICEIDHQSTIDAWNRALKASALGQPRGMGWGGRWEVGSGWGTHAHPWLIHGNVWQKTPQYCGVFCHTLPWISQGCACVPHPEPTSHLPPHPIPLGCPSALALSALFHASIVDWWSISHMIIYMSQCYSLKSSHPRLLPLSPTVYSLHLCLFWYLAYRVIVTTFINSIYMR